MANYFSTKQKIELANSIITEFYENKSASSYNTLIFNEIKEMEQKYISSNNSYWELSDFCIQIAEIPVNHFKLMLTIGWLDCETAEPLSHLKGFYKYVYNGKQGFTKIEHFMTVQAYTDLLFIESEIIDMYK